MLMLPVTAVERQVAILTACGYSACEVGLKLGVSARTVERYRSLPQVKELIEARKGAGLEPEDVLEALLYSKNELTRLRASVELNKLRAPAPPPEDALELPEGAIQLIVHPAGLS